MSTTAERISDIVSLRAKDYVLLSDLESLTSALGNPSSSINDPWQVDKVWHLRFDTFAWKMALLKRQDDLLYLAIKTAGDEHELVIYYDAPEFEQGITKAQLIRNGAQWLFQPPEDSANFKAAKLKITEVLNDKDEDGNDLQYVAKRPEAFGELVGRTGPKPEFLGMKEFRTESKIANPEILVLEVGGLDRHGELSDEGAQIFFLQGCKVSPNDVEPFRQ